jgi:histidinol phosphatase-like enzyme (inositol monophosphatase family)
MEPDDIESYLRFAVEAAEAAGPIALKYFRRGARVSDKATGGFFDPVTAADREIESQLRAEIGRRFPDHGVVGEEHGTIIGGSGLSWVIDPIDGTRAFISGMPAWGVMLGLVEDGEPRLGVVHQPFLGETFYGDRERAWLRAARSGREPVAMQARATRRLADAVLYCTHPSMFRDAGELAAFERVAAACRMPRFGGDCYAYCLLALGEIDMVVESGLQPYDILPLMPILEGAGAVVTDWQGRPPLQGGRVAVAATPELHAELLATLAGQ